MIATNKTQLCCVSSPNKLESYVIKRLVPWGCPHFKLTFSSDSVFLCGGFIPELLRQVEGRILIAFLI